MVRWVVKLSLYKSCRLLVREVDMHRPNEINQYSDPHYFGAHENDRVYPYGVIHGGSGYVFSRESLKQLVLKVCQL